MADWYDINVESGVRDIVRLLRNNGFNTESACHHDMEVVCSYRPEGQIGFLYELLRAHLTNNGEPASFSVSVCFNVENGSFCETPWVQINLTKRPRFPDGEQVIANCQSAASQEANNADS